MMLKTIPLLLLCSILNYVLCVEETKSVCSLNITESCDDSPYRSIDGSYNNLMHPTWGVAENPYGRVLPPAYGDGISSPRQGANKNVLPPARLVRTSLFPTGKKENPEVTLVTMQWGQIVAHDMSLFKEDKDAECCTDGGQPVAEPHPLCLAIEIPKNDSTMGKAGRVCMNFTRTITDRFLGCSKGKKIAKPINVVTSYMDLSNLYGVNLNTSDSLRTFRGGKLISETRKNKMFPPHDEDESSCPCQLSTDKVCYKTGDSRSNQNTELTILQIMLLREHNHLAKELAGINKHWDDETLFQEARRILIAEFQHITYYEWMPVLLGKKNLYEEHVIFDHEGFVNDYNPHVRPSVSSEHAQGAYRSFHSNIAGQLNLVDKFQRKTSSIVISEWINRPEVLEKDNNLEQLTRGLFSQRMEDTDAIIADEMANHMEACLGVGFGLDLKAVDIQRDRDHALQYYHKYKELCGLGTTENFDDFKDLISESNVEIMKKLYSSYMDVDLSVGGALEELVPGTQAGPTFLCILLDQFRRTRQADRFWFENEDNGLTLDQLSEIRKSTGARFFCDNGNGINSIQPKMFETISPSNPLKPCSLIPAMNLNKWKQTS